MSTPDPKATADGAAANSADELKQVKSEFSRKSDNLAQQLQAQQQKIDAIMAAVINNGKQQQQAAAPKQKPSADPIDNPELYAQQIREQTKQEVLDEVRAMNTQQNDTYTQQQQVLNKLVVDYPELNDRSSELFIKAQELQGQMPANERHSPTALRAIIREAAAEVGVLPVSKRAKAKDDNIDDFSVNSGGTNAANRSQNRGTGQKPVSEITKAFAELMGRPVNDEKYMERLTKQSQRKNWSKWR